MKPRKSRSSFQKRSGVSTIIGTLIFVLILMIGLTTIVTIFGYYNNYSAQLLQYDHTVQQNEQISLSNPSLTFGASPNTITSSTASSFSYVPILLTNNQGSAVSTSFQQEIVFSPSSYSSYEASNLGNIRFCEDPQCTYPLYAWLESCSPSCGTAATSATVWVKLASSIAANGGTLTIYLVFESTSTNFDVNYWGEAPNLSGTFGQYDNGGLVFNYYDNGETISGFAAIQNGGTLSLTSVVNPYGTTTSVITVTGSGSTSTSSETVAWFSSPVLGDNFVTEGWININTNLNGLFAFRGASNTALTNYIAGDGWSGDEASIAYESGTTNNLLSGSGTRAAGWLWDQVTVSGSTFKVNIYSSLPSTGGTSVASTTVSDSTLSGSNTYQGIATWSGSTSPAYFFLSRVRINPPSSIMPSTSFGTISGSTGSATANSFQRKLIYSQGHWWAFYSDGAKIGYSTSPDGSVWSAETSLTSSWGSTEGYNFNIWLNGNTLYYVLDAAGQSASFLWRYGTLQPTGTISWTINETAVTTTNKVNSYDSIVTDTSGNVWVALNTNDGTNTHIEVWKYSSGTWVKENDISPLATDITPILEPLANGVALIYGDGGATSQIEVITTATGASWTSPVSPPSDYALFSSSATTMGNTLYFAGLASSSAGVSTGTVNFWSFAYGALATSSEITLKSTNSGWDVSISEEPSDTLIVFYGSGITLSMTYSTNFGNAWSISQTLSSSEASIIGVTSTNSGSGVLWTSGGSSPYNVRFSSVPILSETNESPFIVHLISLYIYNTLSGSLVHFDTNSSSPGVTGSFDFEISPSEQLSMPLASFSWTTNENYLITLATDQGVLESATLTSPS